MSFEDLKLSSALLRAIRAEGYTDPTPIQSQTIPHILQQRDILGCAQTGTGKTAAFALPILHLLAEQKPSQGRHVRALILSPTRELALQLADSFRVYGKHTGLKHTVVFGGVGQNPQVQALKNGVDILVATPGRLLDLMGQGLVNLRRVEILTLDEADQMLDMGFLPSVRQILNALPKERQNLLFSATMPPEISTLADQILKDPAKIFVTPPATTVEQIQQSLYFVSKNDKASLLRHLLQGREMKRVLVFTRTKHGADKLMRKIKDDVEGAVIHGDKSQSAREKALNDFKNQKIWVLVATDIAARGIDVEGITHVINYDIPNPAEVYVHRIGRTARAGSSGVAISFCDPDEVTYLVDIERLTRLRIPVVEEHPYAIDVVVPQPKSQPQRKFTPGQSSPQGQHRDGASADSRPSNRRRWFNDKNKKGGPGQSEKRRPPQRQPKGS
jgi:ATP-dependent RNA helicase RhlE